MKNRELYTAASKDLHKFTIVKVSQIYNYSEKRTGRFCAASSQQQAVDDSKDTFFFIVFVHE